MLVMRRRGSKWAEQERGSDGSGAACTDRPVKQPLFVKPPPRTLLVPRPSQKYAPACVPAPRTPASGVDGSGWERGVVVPPPPPPPTAVPLSCHQATALPAMPPLAPADYSPHTSPTRWPCPQLIALAPALPSASSWGGSWGGGCGSSAGSSSSEARQSWEAAVSAVWRTGAWCTESGDPATPLAQQQQQQERWRPQPCSLEGAAPLTGLLPVAAALETGCSSGLPADENNLEAVLAGLGLLEDVSLDGSVAAGAAAATAAPGAVPSLWTPPPAAAAAQDAAAVAEATNRGSNTLLPVVCDPTAAQGTPGGWFQAAAWAALGGAAAAAEAGPATAPPLLLPPTSSGGCCVVCFDAPRETVLAPCGHRALCQRCTRALVEARRGCPICRAAVETVIERVFDIA